MVESLPILGIALVLAFWAGKIAHHFKLPQVTAYILIGVILGPTVFNLITSEMATNFSVVNELAFGLILFNIGGEFHRGLFKKMTRLHIRYSILMAFFIFLIVFLGCMGFSYFFDGLTLTQKIVFSSFLACVAIAPAPPATLLVIKELGAKGPLTHSIMVFLTVGTIFAITGTHALTNLFQDGGIWSGSDGSMLIHFLLMVWGLVGSLVIGTILGFLLSVWEQKEQDEAELLFAVIVAILLGHSIAYYLKLEPLLISLFMGFALVNSSPVGIMIHKKVKSVGNSIYALFFVIAGAHIHLQTQMKTVGILGLGYILSRTFAYIVSSRIAGRIANEDPTISNRMSWSVLSHGGAALAIAGKIAHEQDASAQAIVTVILSAVFIFEIIGPLLLRNTLIRACEVKLGALLTGGDSSLSYTELTHNFLTNIGVIKPIEQLNIQKIKLLVNRKVFAIEETAEVKEVVNFVDKHQLAIYPVVNAEQAFVGVISLADLQDVMFDPFRVQIKAKRLIGSKVFITQEASLEDAIELFNDNGLEYLPVIDEKSDKLIGTLSYKDVVVALKGQIPINETKPLRSNSEF